MLKGRFGNTSSAPYLEGQLVIPRLGVKGLVSFLVDTGADKALIMPADGIRLGIDYGRLHSPQNYIGIGGNTKIHSEQALVTFSEARFVYTYNVKIGISAALPDLMKAPSLLGRDIINRWKMTYDPAKDRVNFKVGSADFTHKV
jgi:aspartyl protease